MQFEEFDNRIRQAADQHHPSYDEKAWANMEKLLDHEMPQKDDRRRRFLFLLLLFLLLGSGAWLLIGRPWQSRSLATQNPTNESGISTRGDNQSDGNDAAATGAPGGNNNIAGSSAAPPAPAASDNLPASDATARINGSPTASSTPTGKDGEFDISIDAGTKALPARSPRKDDQQLPVNQRPSLVQKDQRKPAKAAQAGNDQFDIAIVGSNVSKRKTGPDKTKPTVSDDNIVTANDPILAPAKGNPANDDTRVPVNTDAPASVAKQNTIPDAKATPRVDKNDDNTDGNADDKAGKKPGDKMVGTTSKDSTATDAVTAEKKVSQQKPNKKKKSELFFSVSAGPDISSVGFSDPGKMKLLTGAGVGYTYKERLTLRTGFYSASKVYDAKPADYKPEQPLPNPTDLKNIAADCKVYEIPVTLSYQFGQSPKHRTFVSAGLSSFLMKKETYVYRYEYLVGGQPMEWYYTHVEDNKFKHYFSVLSLSAGYQRRINKTFSVAVEPYLKLPLGGVGYGNIKLNSAGAMVSLNVSPFK